MKTKKTVLEVLPTNRVFVLNQIWWFFLSIIIWTIFYGCSKVSSMEDEGLFIGWKVEDITPKTSVSLAGQYYERMSTYVQSPLTVTACAIEGIDDKGNKEQAIMVSLDIISFHRNLQDTLRILIKDQIPDFDAKKLILNATHTHSAPRIENSPEFEILVLEKTAKAIVAAWKNRKPSGISHELGYAVVGYNRRIQYKDGTAEMYGLTNIDGFEGVEGPTDPGVEILFCWDLEKNMTGIIMNVACPAQVSEAKYYVSADYWGEVRRYVSKKFSKDIPVLAQIGAAGDIAPRDLIRRNGAFEPNMWDTAGMIEIGKRLGRVIEDVYPKALESIQTKAVFQHLIKNIDLPTRRVSRGEYEKALAIVNKIRAKEPDDQSSPNTAWNRFLNEVREKEMVQEYGPWDSKTSDFGWLRPMEAVLKQYETQVVDTVYQVEVHAIRLGDVAFVTNPFELYVNYGFQISGRSKAAQTFIVQLSGDRGGYLPTKEALLGGGYSAMANHVGPPGGYMLVDESVNLINSMWKDKK